MAKKSLNDLYKYRDPIIEEVRDPESGALLQPGSGGNWKKPPPGSTVQSIVADVLKTQGERSGISSLATMYNAGYFKKLPGWDSKTRTDLGRMIAEGQAKYDSNDFMTQLGPLPLLAAPVAGIASAGTLAGGTAATLMPPAGTVASGAGFAMPAALPVTALNSSVTGGGAAVAAGGASAASSIFGAENLKDVATILSPAASLITAGATLRGAKAAAGNANRMPTIKPPPEMPTIGGPNTIMAERGAVSEQLRRRGRASTIMTAPQSETLGAMP